MTTELQKAKDKIAKLLNMTVEKGATEDEAANAMRLAAGIAARLGIELEGLRPADAPKPKIGEKHKNVMMKPYEAFCARAAAVLYGVECSAPNFGKHGFWYTGREENIEMAEQTMLWLVRQVELLYKQHLPRGLSVRARAEFRASFKDACGQRVYERACEVIRKMKTDEAEAKAATGSNALVVANHFDTLQGEIINYYRDRQNAAIARSQEAEKRRAEERTRRLAAMTEEDRVAFLRREHEAQEALRREQEKWEKKWARQAARRKGGEPRQRSMKIGSGTGVGRQAGDSVKLRNEIGE